MQMIYFLFRKDMLISMFSHPFFLFSHEANSINFMFRWYLYMNMIIHIVDKYYCFLLFFSLSNKDQSWQQFPDVIFFLCAFIVFFSKKKEHLLNNLQQQIFRKSNNCSAWAHRNIIPCFWREKKNREWKHVLGESQLLYQLHRSEMLAIHMFWNTLAKYTFRI